MFTQTYVSKHKKNIITNVLFFLPLFVNIKRDNSPLVHAIKTLKRDTIRKINQHKRIINNKKRIHFFSPSIHAFLKRVTNSQFISNKFKLYFFKRFGENICKLIFGWYKFNIYISIIHMISDKMMSNFYVL